MGTYTTNGRGATVKDVRPLEVAWYRVHGKFPRQRIRRMGSRHHPGLEYVVGDWSWNKGHPDMREHIEERMAAVGIYS